MNIKKSLFLILLCISSLFFGLHYLFAESNTGLSTSQATCPVYTLPNPKEGCTYTYKKNSNGCEVPVLTCKAVEPVCPQYSLKEPEKGCYYKFEKNEAGCEKPVLVCEKAKEDTCPQYNQPIAKDGCKIVTEVWTDGCEKPKEICPTVSTCTQEYAPVCGSVKVCEKNEVGDLKCSQQKRTFSNKCSLKAENAEFISEWKCETKTEPVCPQYSLKEPEKGCYYKFETGSDGCKKPVLVCDKVKEDTCPIEVPAPEGCYYKYDTKANVPQCLQIKTLVCDKKPSCPVYKLAAPKEGCKYTFEINGSWCEVPKLVCSDELPTTKCKDYSNVKIAQSLNGCPLVWYTDENQCKTFKYECKNDTPNTDKIKEKLNQALESLFKKMDSSKLSDEEKITKLKSMVTRLEEHISKKPNLKQLLTFVIEKIQAKIAVIEQENSDGIDDILNILDL